MRTKNEHNLSVDNGTLKVLKQFPVVVYRAFQQDSGSFRSRPGHFCSLLFRRKENITCFKITLFSSFEPTRKINTLSKVESE